MLQLRVRTAGRKHEWWAPCVPMVGGKRREGVGRVPATWKGWDDSPLEPRMSGVRC